MGVKDKVDGMLGLIRMIKGLMANNHRQANEEIERVKSRYADGLASLANDLKRAEKDLETAVKAARAEVLGDGDRADFPSGSVMLTLERRVKQVKGMLDRLKVEGLTEAVKVSKETVDWDVVDGFDDDTLARLGTERIEKDVFLYELAGEDGNG